MSRNVSGQTGKGAEPCAMKIALAERGGEVTVCLSRRLISTHTHTHTHPGDKHRSDSGRILFPFYQEAVPDKGAVCVCLLSKAQVIPQMKTNIKWCSKLEILFPPYLNPLNSPGPQSNQSLSRVGLTGAPTVPLLKQRECPTPDQKKMMSQPFSINYPPHNSNLHQVLLTAAKNFLKIALLYLPSGVLLPQQKTHSYIFQDQPQFAYRYIYLYFL